MYEKRNEQAEAGVPIHPLKSLTREQFAALGGDAVAYVRPVVGFLLAAIIEDTDFEPNEIYQLVMSADGTPLLVTDTAEAVNDWLGDKNLGVATLH